MTTWINQYIEDNTYSQVKEEIYYCEECGRDTLHSVVRGRDQYDSYSYADCMECSCEPKAA